MTVLYDPQRKGVFQLFEHALESDFEKVVCSLAEQIFGEDTIYIDVKKRVKSGDIITIPDGYLLDATDPDQPTLYVIENEIVSHDPFKHIGIQLLKFATSFDEGKTTIRNFLMEEITKSKDSMELLEKFTKKSSYRNIDNFLDAAVLGTFKALVVIDEARPELHHVLEKINADISVLELKTYVDDQNNFMYEFDTLYDEIDATSSPDVKPKSLSKEEITRRRERRAKCDTIVVPARKEGFNEVFLGENRWFAIRIGAAMKDKIKYIAAYQISPICAITHIAKIKEIRPYQDTGKYEVVFDGAAEEITPVKISNPAQSPQCPVYVEYQKIDSADSVDDLLK
jgi:hypothetical protein